MRLYDTLLLGIKCLSHFINNNVGTSLRTSAFSTIYNPYILIKRTLLKKSEKQMYGHISEGHMSIYSMQEEVIPKFNLQKLKK